MIIFILGLIAVATIFSFILKQFELGVLWLILMTLLGIFDMLDKKKK